MCRLVRDLKDGLCGYVAARGHVQVGCMEVWVGALCGCVQVCAGVCAGEWVCGYVDMWVCVCGFLVVCGYVRVGVHVGEVG